MGGLFCSNHIGDICLCFQNGTLAMTVILACCPCRELFIYIYISGWWFHTLLKHIRGWFFSIYGKKPSKPPTTYIYILYIYICIIRVAPHTGTRGEIWVISKGERYNDPIPPIQWRPDSLCWSNPEDALAVERWRRQDTSSLAMVPRAAWPICPQLFSLTVIAAKVSDGHIQKGTHIMWKTQ